MLGDTVRERCTSKSEKNDEGATEPVIDALNKASKASPTTPPTRDGIGARRHVTCVAMREALTLKTNKDSMKTCTCTMERLVPVTSPARVASGDKVSGMLTDATTTSTARKATILSMAAYCNELESHSGTIR